MFPIHGARLFDDTAQGRRILVDRLWLRGVRKDAGLLDEWVRDAAPSTPLRLWYGHAPERFEEFVRRYREELRDDAHRAAVDLLLDRAATAPLVLLTTSREFTISHVPVLRAFLEDARG
ncbi:MAG: DUF488 domain-containing protein [Clostridia bacterium]